MKRFLIPDYYFDTYEQITPKFLDEHGIKALILDVDNTLAPYEQSKPDERNIAWIETMRQAGILMAVVSNNHRARVEPFAAALGLPAFCDAGKPFSYKIVRAMRAMGADPSATAAVGDQIYTDVLTARFSNMKAAIIVPPIKDKKDLFTKFKRLCEKPVMAAFYRKEKRDDK